MDSIQTALRELPPPLVPDFSDAFDLRPLNLKNVVSLVRATGYAVSSAFLPVFETGNGDLLAVHLAPGKALVDQAWVLLPHDEFSPEIIASDLKTLLRVTPVSRLAPPTMGPAQWKALQYADLLAPEDDCRIEEGEYAERLERLKDPDLVRAELDPSNVLQGIGAAMDRAADLDEAIRVLEELAARYPTDSYAICFRALIEDSRFGAEAPRLAELALRQEMPWASSMQGRWLSSWLSPEILLDKLKDILLAAGGPSGELKFLTDSSFLQPQGAAPLADVARALRSSGKLTEALAVARNGMLVSLHVPSLRGPWYSLVRELSEQVHPDSLISSVASLIDDAWRERTTRAERSSSGRKSKGNKSGA